ncbi:MAG: hypothetical protein H7177_03715 [Rhizobacter sp.]|nr:hypothetical protein [Bacteriovorax sp.]
MKNKIYKVVCFSFLLACSVFTNVEAGESSVPLQKGLRIASDDLIYQDQILTSRDADVLGNAQKIDLSKLNPKSNDIWDNTVTSVDDQGSIAINDNDVLSYEGAILSNTGLFRFNAIPVNGNKIYTIHMDKSLHTMLMRKNLLRTLGYKIPAMKYLKKVTIQFSSKIAMEAFVKREVPEATLGAADRWTNTDLTKATNLTLTLKDVAITEPNEFDFYNVSMGVPTQTINSRSLRALLLPYSLVDLYESVNKFSYVDGKQDNKSVILPHFTGNDFATTVDDAIWMLNKMNNLTRADYQKIVAGAYFPKEIESVLVEKLISRRNSLNRLFNLKTSEIAFNNMINVGSSVKEGKVIQKDFPDYASRFAYGDAESPLEQLRFFLYGKIQATVIDNLINKLNGEMSVFDLTQKRTDYFEKQFKTGLDHFVQTGELLPISVGAWYAPVLDIQLLLSRDIILGNYLGTDNLVQLADTFGASADIGVFAGIEGIGAGLSGGVKVSTSLVRSFTHLKPVKNLKESLKEPYKNMFVGLLKRSLKDKFFSLSELKEIDEKDANGDTKKEERKKKIEELFSEIDKNLDVGESLIITDRLVPSASVRLSFSQGLIGAGVGVSGGVTVLKRIHLYKKSAKMLQIYDDSGFVRNIDLSLTVSNYLTLVKLSAGYDKGHYNVNSYMVNLSTDTAENPNLFSNALGIYNVLKNKDFELLDKNNPPVKLDVQFKDKSKTLSLLFWRMKSLTGKTYYDIQAKDGVVGSYYSLEKDFLTGLNPESFSKQLMNYYLQKQDVKDVSINEETNKNPGESFFGRSNTQKLRYEATVGPDKKFGQKFLALSDIKQGWAMSESKIKNFMKKTNEKFQYNLFEPDAVDFKKVRLFNIGYHMNMYNKGLERLHTIKSSELDAIQTRYQSTTRICPDDNQQKHSAYCGDLWYVKSVIKKCEKTINDEEKADCSVKLFQQLMDDLDFKDFRTLLGEDNFYVYGSIDGFREKSEILNDTLFSNTIGKIGAKQWDGPLDVVRELLGLTGGELSGGWIRTGL